MPGKLTAAIITNSVVVFFNHKLEIQCNFCIDKQLTETCKQSTKVF